MGNFEIYLLNPSKLWNNIKTKYKKTPLLVLLNTVIVIIMNILLYKDFQAFFNKECGFASITGDILFTVAVTLYYIFTIVKITNIKPHIVYEIIYISLLILTLVLWVIFRFDILDQIIQFLNSL